MRFTKNGSSVDLDKAEKEVMAAIKAGVNYFDTAYVYACLLYTSTMIHSSSRIV